MLLARFAPLLLLFAGLVHTGCDGADEPAASAPPDPSATDGTAAASESAASPEPLDPTEDALRREFEQAIAEQQEPGEAIQQAIFGDEAERQAASGLETVFDGLAETLAAPEWQIRQMPLAPMMLEAIFGDAKADPDDAEPLAAHIVEARGLVMNDRAAMTRGNLTVYRMDRAAWAAKLVAYRNADEQRQLESPGFGLEATTPPTLTDLEGIEGDVATAMTCTLASGGMTIAMQSLRVARGPIVLELNDQGLGIDRDAALAAMERVFGRLAP